jgi:hypothetical protein
MHPQFPDWYRLTDADLQQEQLENRWSGVERLVQWHKKKKWLDCVRLFFGHPFSEIESHEGFVEIMRKDDSTFPSRGNELEVQVLVGAAILNKIDNPSEIADLTSLAVLCAYCGGKRNGDVIMEEVIEEAHRYLQERGRNVRERSEAEDYFSEISTGDAAFADIEELDEGLGNVGSRDAQKVNRRLKTTNARFNQLLKAYKSLSAELSSVVANVGEAAERMVEERLETMEEELDILWWLFGEQSHKLEKPFAEMSTAEMVSTAADELSEKTTLVPGPPSVKDLLGKALLLSNDGDPSVLGKKVSFKELAESTKSDWREKRGTRLGNHSATLEDFAPVLCSIATANEMGGDGWTTYYEQKTGMDATMSMEALDMAMQAYNEALLLRIT